MSNDLLRGRQVAVSLTNKSGGGVVEGDVVIIDSSTAASFTTTTTENQITDMVGVVLETIAGDASGRVCLSGYVPVIKLDASASLGDTFGTDSVAKQASPHNALAAGDFGQVLGTGTTPAAVLWGGYPHTVATGMANPMTAEGDIIYGGSSGTPTKLVKGDDDDVLTLASGVPTWAAAAGGGFSTGDIQQVELYRSTLAEAANFDVSSISQDYDHLLIRVMLQSSVAAAEDAVNLILNNDSTGSNYLRQVGQFADSNPSGASADDLKIAGCPAASGYTSSLSATEILILDYANTTFHKICQSKTGYRYSATVPVIIFYTLFWESTAAINRITIQPDGYSTDNFIAGSWLQIIGVKTVS